MSWLSKLLGRKDRRAAADGKRAALMSEDFDQPTRQPSLRFALCATPRTGSTLIGRGLMQTGLAGLPLEYLNPRNIRLLAQRGLSADGDAARLLDLIEPRRTSANGRFGIQLHFDHLPETTQAEIAQAESLLGRFDALILIRRDDLLAQAISWARAQSSDLWTVERTDSHRSMPPLPPCPHDLIEDCLEKIQAYRQGWEQLLARQTAPVLRISYEELTADYPARMTDILRHLGIAEPPSGLFADMPLVKLADATSDAWRESYLTHR